MDAPVVEALAELIGLEFEDRHVEGAVAEEHAVREHPIRPADLLEVERLLVEFGHLLRVFRGDGDVTQLGHANLLTLLIAQPTTTGALSKLYKPGQNGGRAHPNLDHPSRPLAGSNRESVRGSCRRVKAPPPTGIARTGRIPAAMSRRRGQNAKCRQHSEDRPAGAGSRRNWPYP